MYTLSSFRRRLFHGGQRTSSTRDVGLGPAQQHGGENIGDTPSHSIFAS